MAKGVGEREVVATNSDVDFLIIHLFLTKIYNIIFYLVKFVIILF